MDTSVWRVRTHAPPTAGGPLDGVRVAVKDLFAVAGCATGAGNPQWLASAKPAAEDAPAVARLRAAGATVEGLAQTDELAFSLSGTNLHYGTPPNPAAPDRVTGGSTSGPAAAVALGAADVGLGTDTAGSIRVPASCCGLYGLRPTHGVVPIEGVVGLAPSFDTVGWLARDPGTLRAVGDALLPPSAVTVPSHLLLPPDVPASVRTAARECAARWGAELVEVWAPWADVTPALLAAFRVAQAAQAWRLHGAWIDAHPGALAPDVEERFRYGAPVTTVDEERAHDLLQKWKASVEVSDRVWLALPAAGGPAHPRRAGDADKNAWRLATLRRTILASACGLPSAVVPTGVTPPLGLALVAAAGADRALLEALVG